MLFTSLPLDSQIVTKCVKVVFQSKAALHVKKTSQSVVGKCYGMRHFDMLCSVCVYYLKVFCLPFVSITKALYDALVFVQLKRH